MGDGGREGHKDTDGVSFVANIYAISYPYTSLVGSFVPPGFSSGREAGCYLNFPFRSCNSCSSPFPTINYNEATISVSTNTEFSFPPISPIIPRQFFYLIGRLAARQVAKLLPLKAVINDSTVVSSFAREDKNLLRPETGNRGDGDGCRSLQDRSEVCAVR